MTHEDYQLLLKGDLGKYYEGRWEYFKEVIEIIKNEEIKSVLEIGPAQEPIVKNCDVMIKPEDDMWGRPKNELFQSVDASKLQIISSAVSP